MRPIRLFSLALVALLGSCGSIEVDARAYPHMLCVDSDGAPAALLISDTSEVRETERRESPNEDHVRAIATHYWQECIERKLLPRDFPITFVIHGGLVSMSQSVKETALAYRQLLDAGTYPVFINWETGIRDSYFDYLTVDEGRRVPLLGWRLLGLPLLLVRDVAVALVQVPYRLFGEVNNSVDVYRDQRPVAVPEGWTESAWIDTREQDTSGLAKSGSLFLEVFPGSLRVLTTPLLDTVATRAYENMHRRARVLFHRVIDFDRGVHQSSGALALLMEQLLRATEHKTGTIGRIISKLRIELAHAPDEDRAELLRKVEIAQAIRDSNQHEFESLPFRCVGEPRFRIIAHSMGATVGNQLIRAYGKEATFEQIVYMGAACTIKQFADQALPYIARHAGCRFYNLCLHPLDEISEWQYGATMPHGSLLVWVDSYLTQHKNELDRTLGRWNNLMKALPIMDHLTSDVRARMVIRGFGRQSGFPRMHGDFNDVDMEYWTREFWDPFEDPRTLCLANAARSLARDGVQDVTIRRSLDLRTLRRELAWQLAAADSPSIVGSVFDSVYRRVPEMAPTIKHREDLYDLLRFQCEARHRVLGGHGQLGRIRPLCDLVLLEGGSGSIELIMPNSVRDVQVHSHDPDIEASLRSGPDGHAGLAICTLEVRAQTDRPRKASVILRGKDDTTERPGSEPATMHPLHVWLVPPTLPAPSGLLVRRGNKITRELSHRWQWEPGTELLVPLHQLEPPFPRSVRSVIKRVSIGETVFPHRFEDHRYLVIPNSSRGVLHAENIRTSPLRLQFD